MDQVIDGEWIKQRLTGRRGEKVALAQALGITKTMMTNILNGARNVQPHEVPKLLAYFRTTPAQALDAPPSGFADGPALPFHPEEMPQALRIAAVLCPGVRSVRAFRIAASMVSFGLLRRDVILIDEDAEPKPGDLLLALIRDPASGTEMTEVRRHFGALAETPSGHVATSGEGQRVAGVIVASYRVREETG